jgi:hypothetical protein
MPITMNSARQYPLVAEVEINFGDYTSGVAAKAFEVPAGAVIQNVELFVDTAWDSATSAVVTAIGDGGDVDRYYAAGTFNLKTLSGFLQGTGTSPETLITGFKYTTPDSIDVVITHSGAPTVGKATMRITYIISGTGRSHEVQPVNGSI